jgi:hypothetical protein
MLSDSKASELGCAPNDFSCLCQNVNFTYGLRDCSAAVCNSEDASRILAYGQALCSGYGIEITTASGSAIVTVSFSFMVFAIPWCSALTIGTERWH